MSDTSEQDAPARAPKTQLDVILAGTKELLPAVALSVTLPLMCFHAMPDSNEKVVLSLVSGLFGFLTGRASARAAKP